MSYASFDTKFAKIGPSVARSKVTRTSAQNLPKIRMHFAYVCVQNTWKLLIFLNALKQCLFCLFGHLHNLLYLEINQDQITTKKKIMKTMKYIRNKHNKIHKKFTKQ